MLFRLTPRTMTRQRAPIAVLVSALTSAGLAQAAPDCFAAADAMAERQWSQAERTLRDLIDEPACGEHRISLRFSLAYVREQQMAIDPEAACEAWALYRMLSAEGGEPKIAEASRLGVVRTAAECRTAEPAPASDSVAVDTDSTGPILAGTSAAVLVAGGLLLWLATGADAERESAEAAMRARHAAGDADGVARAERDFVDAADRTNVFGLAGYGALTVGVLLGVGAAWAFADGGAPSVSVHPGGIAVIGVF